MLETEYIKVANLTHVRAALSELRNVLPGYDGVIEEAKLKDAIETLYRWQECISRSLNIKADT